MRVPLCAYPFSMLPPIAWAEIIYYSIIAAFGVPANVVSIVILSLGKCSLSKSVSRSLVAMAAADLLVVVTDVILYRFNDFYFPTSFLFITQVCSFHRVFIHVVTDISVWLTLAFTSDRHVMICQKMSIKYCTEKTAGRVIATMCPLFCCKNIPWYFAFEPLVTEHNFLWGCHAKGEVYTEPAWMTFTWIHRCLTPLLPMFLITLLNVLTVEHILAASRVRKSLIGSKTDENPNAGEMENGRKSIIFLFAISGNFILFWMPYLIFFLLVQITKRYYSTSFTDPIFIADQASYMLLLLSCCTNTCIYAVTQTKFRKELKNGMGYPLRIILKYVKNRKC